MLAILTKKPRFSDLYGALIFFLSFCLAIFSIQEPDLGFHLAAGKMMAETGILPLTDYFTFTRFGLPDYSHSLFSGFLFYKIFQWGDFPALILTRGMLVGLCFLLVFKIARLLQPKGTPNRLSLLVLVLLGAFLARGRLQLQPFLFSDLLLLYTVLHLFRFRQDQKKEHLWWVLFGFALWFQLHLAVVQGLLVIILFWVSLGLEGKKRLWQASMQLCLPLLVLIGGLSAWTNPSSRNLWTHLYLEVLNAPKQAWIAEYQSAWETLPKTMVFVCGSSAILFFIALWRKHRPDLFVVLLFGFFLVLASRVQREITHLIWAWILLLHAGMEGWRNERLPISRTSITLRCGVVGFKLGALAICGGLVFVELHHPLYPIGWDVDESRIPRPAFAFVAKYLRPERLYNTMHVGGWWSFFYGNETKIYHDGRGPLYDRRFFADNVLPFLNPATGRNGQPPPWERILSEEQVGAALVDIADPMCEALRGSPAWQLTYFDSVAAVFVPQGRKDLPVFRYLNPCQDDTAFWTSLEMQMSREWSREIQQMALLYPDNGRAHYIAGLYLARKGYFLKALTCFGISQSFSPARLNVWGNIARLACAIEQYEESERAFREAQVVEMASESFWQAWQVCLRKQGKTREARRIAWRGYFLQKYFSWRG